MNAIVSIKPGGTGDQTRATYDKILYLFSPHKNGSAKLDRVSWIGGNLDGHGPTSRKASQMAIAMDYGHENLHGRRHRHLVVSCEPCSDHATRSDAKQRLQKSASLLAKLLGVRRWIAVVHQDTEAIHMHIIIANFDEDNGRRFDFDRRILSQIQEMTWTPYLSKGKGRSTGKRGARGEAIERLRKNRKKENPQKRAKALEKLAKLLSKRGAGSAENKDAIVAALSSKELPSKWDGSKLVNKSGEPKAKPSLTIDGIQIRIDFYLRNTRGFAVPAIPEEMPI
ncbi:MAG: relaxase/mobilization nuclease domain-containing protein [Luteolibacter sp.]